MPGRANDDHASVAVHLRLSRAAWERYASEAAAISTPLSTYLRDRLEREDELLAELASIRRAVENLAATASVPATSSTSPMSPSILLEVLLLCRSLAQPQRAEMVQAELRRLGLDAYQPAAPTRGAERGRR